MSKAGKRRTRKRRRNGTTTTHKGKSGRTGSMFAKKLRSAHPSKKRIKAIFEALGLEKGKYRMGA